MEANNLTATGLKSSTGRYNPSSTGPGPVTNGAISIFTTEDNIDQAGYEVIQIVQHNIQYKEKSASGQYRHRGDRKIISKTLYWNNGRPSFHSIRKYHKSVWNENIKDKWHLNVVKSPKQPDRVRSEMVGYWCAECKIENLTDLWHSMREKIISGILGPVKMDCPGSRRKRVNPLVLVWTAQQNVENVGSALKSTELILSVNYVQTSKEQTHKSCTPEIPFFER